MTGAAAHVGNDRLDILAANPLGRALFVEMFDGQAAPERRALRLPRPARPRVLSSTGTAPPATSSRSCARPPAATPTTATSSDLVGELSTRSEEFRSHWARHDVRFHISGVKHFHHPVVGDLELNYERLEVAVDTGLTIFTYTADPGTRSAEALGLLGSLVATPALTEE